MKTFDIVRRAACILWILVSMGGNSAAYAADVGVPSDARSGTLYLKASADAEAVEALRGTTTIRAAVTGNVARVHVTQTFENGGDDWVEGLYVFPLSADAAVDELQMQVGARKVHGEIHEKQQAKVLYARARSEGRQAGIVEQDRPNLFSTAVANIEPHSSISLEITYLETIPYRDFRYTLRLPLAITPRYRPGAILDPAEPATSARVTAPAQGVNIDVELAPGFPLGAVTSLHHVVETFDTPSGRRIHLVGGGTATDRDFELVWTPAPAEEVAVAAFAEKVGGDTFALLVMTPPLAVPPSAAPREVTFIIDTSGSMSGPSIEQASAALQMGVDRLKPGDRFNIIRFASEFSSLFAAPQPVSDTSRTLAGRFIAGLRADGGTEMRAPLELAMSASQDAQDAQQIVFITDGSVGNEDELIGLIHRRIGHSRLFTVGIGAAPNVYFLQQAAAAGRGSYTFIAEREQVGSRMQELFRKLESPALVDLELRWPGGFAADLAAAVPGDLFAGDPLVVLARLAGSPTGMLTLSGRMRGEAWIRQIPITPVGDAAGVAKLWARERIADLSRHLQFGGDRPALERDILDVALQHGLVSQFTSLVAVDETRERPLGSPGHVEQVPTSAPAGGYWATTGFAKTATPAGLLLLCGTICLLSGGMLLVTNAARRRSR